MPSPSFSSHNNLAVEVIDPMFLQESKFLSLVDDKYVFSSHCESLKEQQTGFFRFKLNVCNILKMANPVPQRVLRLLKEIEFLL
jgi:hypothetical protein